MKHIKAISLALAVVVTTTAANASVMSFTEGNRNTIVGSTVVTANGTGTGDVASYDLGALGADDTINLYGRIIGIDDFYTFSSATAFTVKWIFGGYTSVANSAPSNLGQTTGPGGSGFVSTPLTKAGDAKAEFSLINTATNAIVGVNNYVTNIVSGANEFLFAGTFAAGDYAFNIDGAGPQDGLYDVTFQSGPATVPLPAGGLLLLSALGGLGLTRRRKNKAV